MARDIEEGENPNIDEDTRARAMASVADLGKPVAVPGRGGPVAAPAYGMTLADRQTPRNKPSAVTKEELQKSGLSLRDYMNKQQGLTRRQDKPSYAKGGSVSASSQGGSINLSNCKVSTVQKNSSSPKW